MKKKKVELQHQTNKIESPRAIIRLFQKKKKIIIELDFSSKENAKKPWHTGRNRETSSKRGPKRKKKKKYSRWLKRKKGKKKKSLLEGEDYLVGEAVSEPLRW